MRTRLLLVPALLALAGPAAAQPDQRIWAIGLPKQGDGVLRFAFPNTDDLMVGLTCAKKTGQVRVIGASPVRLNEMRDPDAPPAKPIVLKRRATVNLSSGEASTSIPQDRAPADQRPARGGRSAARAGRAGAEVPGLLPLRPPVRGG
jgi:hypothetical protein